MKFITKILDFEVNEKNFKNIVVLTLIVICILMITIFLNIGIMHKYKIPDNIETGVNEKIVYKINSIVTSRKYVEIQGWAYKKDKNIGYFNNRYIIRNEATNEYKALKTQMKFENEFFSIDDKYDCRRAGMYAKGIAVGLKKGLYQIFIEYKNDDENILVDSGIFFNF